MAWGYERGFVVEHDPTVKRKIDCKSCVYYESSDKSCLKRPQYLPVDGYNSWKNCNYFELDSTTSNYELKKEQLDKFQKKNSHNMLKADKLSGVKKNAISSKVKSKTTDGEVLKAGYHVCPVEGKVKVKPLEYKYVNVKLRNGKNIKIQVAYHIETKRAYVNSLVYTREAISCLKELQKL